MRGGRGFTLLELAIALTIAGTAVPAVFLSWRSLEGQLAIAQWDVSTAEQVRTAYEELARDARLGRLSPSAVEFELRGGCGLARWAVTPERRLVRTASPECGGERAVATGVEGLRRTAGGVELDFVFEVRPDLEQRRTVFLPVEDGR